MLKNKIFSGLIIKYLQQQMTTSIEQWIQIIQHQLEQHAQVNTVDVKKSSPPSESLIKTAEALFSHDAHTAFLAFYRYTNGLQIQPSFRVPSFAAPSFISASTYLHFPTLETILEQLSKGRAIVMGGKGANENLELAIVNGEPHFYQENKPVTFADHLKNLSESYILTVEKRVKNQLFPCSDQLGADAQHIKTGFIQQKAAQTTAITNELLEEQIRQHHEFLSRGGAGGNWKVFHLSGMVFGVYNGATATGGKQANFKHQNLSGKTINTQQLLLPFTNFCGMYAPHQNFMQSDFSYSLFTDAMLENAVFSNSNLEKSDFSRANLSGANFKNANLKGADFENCNLQGADFRGANWKGAKFPGANLENILF